MTTLTRRLLGATLLATPLLFGATDARAAGLNFVTAWTASCWGRSSSTVREPDIDAST